MSRIQSKFAGTLKILQYNWHFYAASSIVTSAIVALLWSMHLPFLGLVMLIAVALLTVFWSLSSLAASYYIYDYRAVTQWRWVTEALNWAPERWANIHAGLDESTPTLSQIYPRSQHIVIDIYDAQEMTESSIARARRLHPPIDAPIAAKMDHLPLPDGDRDTLFLLFAAHEIRDHGGRTKFFLEAARIMAPSGQLLLVEHLRDWKNFVAFGPGFFHFHSRSEWLRLAREAGLAVERESQQTPFVRCFLMTKVVTP